VICHDRRRQSVAPFVAVALIVALASALAACGPTTTARPSPSPTAVSTGMRITYAVEGAGGSDATDAVRRLLAARAAGLGIDATVTAREPATVVLESRSPITPEEQRLLLARADLRVIPLPVERFGNVEQPGPEVLLPGGPVPTGLEVLLTTADVDPAAVTMTSDAGGSPAVSIGFAPDAAKALATWSRAHVGEFVALAVDGLAVIVPAVMSPLDDGSVVISMGEGQAWPKPADLAAIRGAFPPGVTLTVEAIEAIPAQ
jgi:hypothetical protein